jgi:hypothetical protein
MAKTPLSNVTRKNKRTSVAGKTAAAGAPSGLTSLSADDVALRAYLIYLEEGCPEGRHLDHWTRAESELRSS